LISQLKGKLLRKSPAQIVLEVGGIGFSVNIPLSSYEKVGAIGEDVEILTYLHVKEDSLSLFGFSSEEERDLFVELLSVSGVGPKLAQNILSAMSVSEFQMAVLEGDLKALGEIPGVGRKMAQRLVVELKDRFGKLEWAEASGLIPGGGGKLTPVQEAVLALIQLGFKGTVARNIVDRVVSESEGELPVEEIVRRALKQI